MAAAKAARAHTILITGASDGVGLLLAKAYANRGHKVLATGRRQIADDKEFFQSSNVVYVSADLSAPDYATGRIISAMNDLGWDQLDLAILNGATAWVGPPEEETALSIKTQLDVNFRAQIHLARELAPLLFAANGQLVFIGSTSFSKAKGKFATYVATKAGLDGLCRSLREEWRGKADVLMIHPGPMRTSMHAKAGMKIGVARLFFMSPRRAARAIQFAIRRRKGRQSRRNLSRWYAFRSWFSRAREGRL